MTFFSLYHFFPSKGLLGLKNLLIFDTIERSHFETRNRRTHEEIILIYITGLALTLGLMNTVQADEYLRIGMEAAYAPFNWTQDDDSNGAVKIDGTNQYANVMTFKLPRKLLRI